MTLKELMEKERPDLVSPEHWGSVASCPSNYDFLPENMNMCKKGYIGASGESCERCWNQEIPENVDEVRNEYTESAEKSRRFMEAYVKVGFTREEALTLLVAGVKASGGGLKK